MSKAGKCSGSRQDVKSRDMATTSPARVRVANRVQWLDAVRRIGSPVQTVRVSSLSISQFQVSRGGIGEDVAESYTRRGLYLEHPGPAGRIVGGAEVGEAVAVAGATGGYELSIGGEFEQSVVGEVGAGAVDLKG